jgi:hypothetical protein
MFREVEELYKKESSYNRITRKSFKVYILIVIIMWILGILNIPLIIIPLSILMLWTIKHISEKELKQKFHFDFKTKNKGNKIRDEINKQEIKLIKDYLMSKNMFNQTVVNNLINHYRSSNVPKNQGGNFIAIISCIISLIIPFISKDGFDFNSLSKVTPYFLSLIFVCGMVYLSYKQLFILSKSLKGERGMYERLDEILSEILVDIITDESRNDVKPKTIKRIKKR